MLEPNRPDVHGWLFFGCGPRPGVFERVRAGLVVEHYPRIIRQELLVDLDLDEAGCVIGWPGPLAHRWMTPFSERRAVGGDPFIFTLYPALVALERLNVEGDSIRAHTYPKEDDENRLKRGLRPFFPYVIPSPRS